MSSTIPDLWSNDISVKVVSPLAILRAQEGSLAQKTQGILHAQTTTASSNTFDLHRLDLIAPTLGNYRKTLLTAKHRNHEVYPVLIQASALNPPSKPLSFQALTNPENLIHNEILDESSWINSVIQKNQRIANTQEEFIDIVREVLRSGSTRSLIQSLIARSNESGQGVEVSDDPAPEGG